MRTNCRRNDAATNILAVVAGVFFNDNFGHDKWVFFFIKYHQRQLD